MSGIRIDIETAGSEKRRAVSGDLLQILQESIETLDISVASYNCLKNANINTIAELVAKSEQEVLETAKSSRKTVYNIKEALMPHGIALGSKFFDNSSGRELPVREVLSARAEDQVALFAPVASQMSSGLRAEIQYVFNQAGLEMAWPMPPRIQDDLERRLRFARVLDEYTKG